MSVDYKFGFIVTVPEDNGYDQESFIKRVIPHLHQDIGGNYFVPALQKIIMPNQNGHLESTDKIFGVETNLSTLGWAEAYQDRTKVRSTIEDFYGLGVAFASIRYESLVTLVFKVTDTPRLG